MVAFAMTMLVWAWLNMIMSIYMLIILYVYVVVCIVPILIIGKNFFLNSCIDLWIAMQRSLGGENPRNS